MNLWEDLGSIGTFFTGVGALAVFRRTRHVTKVNKELHQSLANELEICERRSARQQRDIEKLRNKVSALETDIVVIRKLLPGGEWFTKLGLEDDQS